MSDISNLIISDTPAEKEAREKFESMVASLGKKVEAKVRGKSVEDVKSYADSTEGSLAIFKWWLMKKTEKGILLNFEAEELDYILSTREVLEMVMTSGDVKDDKYTQVLEILVDLIREDPLIKSEPLRLRLAVASALTGSTPVGSMAFGRSRKMDIRDLYKEFVQSSKDGTFFQPFFEGTAWHLRYVTTTCQTPEERIWARENTADSYRNPDRIGAYVHQMVDYKLENDDGVSVFDGAVYHYWLPYTLEAIHEIGGVCGAISNFGIAMCHAFGIPAALVGQPRHCAYIWYRNGKWELGNSAGSWDQSSMISWAQYTWNRDAFYFPLMNDAQKHLEDYRLSEKMRIASKFSNPEDRLQILDVASSECPYNFAVWPELLRAMEEPNLSKDLVHDTLLPHLVAHRQIQSEIQDIAWRKKIVSDCFNETCYLMNDGREHHASCKEQTADFEVDLEKPSNINEVKIKWWGWSKAAEFDVYAMSEDGNYVLVKTQEDERVEGSFNHWSYLEGWEMRTLKIKFELRKGRKDAWGGDVYFGIRQFMVIGVAHEFVEDVSTGMPVAANSGSSDPNTLVDNDSSTVWHSNTAKHSWFEIDLKKISVLHDIELEWAGEQRPKKMQVKYQCGNGEKTTVSTDGPYDKVYQTTFFNCYQNWTYHLSSEKYLDWNL